MNGTVRQDSNDYFGENYLQAELVVAPLIDEYNHVRLHAALGYLEPRELHFGNPEQRRQQRREKARQNPTEQKNRKPQPNGCLTEPNHYNLGTGKKSKLT